MSISDVEELDLIQYRCYLRDAHIYNLSQTEDGQEYLDNAYRLTLTDLDRNKLKEKYGKQSSDD